MSYVVLLWIFNAVECLFLTLGMKDLPARVRGLGSVTWKGCEWVELLVVQPRLTGSGIIFLIS